MTDDPKVSQIPTDPLTHLANDALSELRRSPIAERLRGKDLLLIVSDGEGQGSGGVFPGGSEAEALGKMAYMTGHLCGRLVSLCPPVRPLMRQLLAPVFEVEDERIHFPECAHTAEDLRAVTRDMEPGKAALFALGALAAGFDAPIVARVVQWRLDGKQVFSDVPFAEMASHLREAIAKGKQGGLGFGPQTAAYMEETLRLVDRAAAEVASR